MSLMMPDGKSWTRPWPKQEFPTYNGPMIPVAGKGGAPSYGQQSTGASGWGGQQSAGSKADSSPYGSSAYGAYSPGQAQPMQPSSVSSYGSRIRQLPVLTRPAGYTGGRGSSEGYKWAMAHKRAAQEAWRERQGGGETNGQPVPSNQGFLQGWNDLITPYAAGTTAATPARSFGGERIDGPVPSNQGFTQGWNDSMAQYANTPGMRFTPAQSFGGEGDGNLAYAQNRPQPFQASVTGFGAQMAPQDFTAQRDAFIQRLNDERSKQAAQSGVYYPNEIPQFYQPNRDFGSLWKQAGDMVNDGWKNPLAGLFG